MIPTIDQSTEQDDVHASSQTHTSSYKHICLFIEESFCAKDVKWSQRDKNDDLHGHAIPRGKGDGICDRDVPNHLVETFAYSQPSYASSPAFLDSVRQVRWPRSCVPWHARIFGIVHDGNLYTSFRHGRHCKQFWFDLCSNNSSPANGFLHLESLRTEICATSTFSMLLGKPSAFQWRLKMFESMLGEPERTAQVHRITREANIERTAEIRSSGSGTSFDSFSSAIERD